MPVRLGDGPSADEASTDASTAVLAVAGYLADAVGEDENAQRTLRRFILGGDDEFVGAEPGVINGRCEVGVREAEGDEDCESDDQGEG